jgi:hypothetical protein
MHVYASRSLLQNEHIKKLGRPAKLTLLVY